MKVAQRDTVILRDGHQGEIRVAQVCVDVSLHRPQTRLLHARLGLGLMAGLTADSHGEDVHKLLAEPSSGVRVESRALRRQRGAEFGGDAAEALAEMDRPEQRRPARVEASIERLAWQFDPELARLDV